MSTQRRRVLEGDGGKTAITDNGVYIEGLNGKFYTVDNWKSSYSANSVVVASGDVKFRIALIKPSPLPMCLKSGLDFGENAVTGETAGMWAVKDYNGAENTANILKVQSGTDYAAGYCDAFVFPDGKTKGFLPALGQLSIAHRNNEAVNAALSKCGGTEMEDNYYWSSTLWGDNGSTSYSACWVLYFGYGTTFGGDVDSPFNFRTFADI